MGHIQFFRNMKSVSVTLKLAQLFIFSDRRDPVGAYRVVVVVVLCLCLYYASLFQFTETFLKTATMS